MIILSSSQLIHKEKVPRKIAGLEPVHCWLHKGVPMALLGTVGSVGRSWAGRARDRTGAGQAGQDHNVGAGPEGKEPSRTCRTPLPCKVISSQE